MLTARVKGRGFISIFPVTDQKQEKIEPGIGGDEHIIRIQKSSMSQNCQAYGN